MKRIPHPSLRVGFHLDPKERLFQYEFKRAICVILEGLCRYTPLYRSPWSHWLPQIGKSPLTDALCEAGVHSHL